MTVGQVLGVGGDRTQTLPAKATRSILGPSGLPL